MSKVDELLWQMWLDEHGEEDFDEHKTKIKQALYKDLYEIISFSADRGEAYKKLKDYFGETND
jgi:hypothetical protein